MRVRIAALKTRLCFISGGSRIKQAGSHSLFGRRFVKPAGRKIEGLLCYALRAAL